MRWIRVFWLAMMLLVPGQTQAATASIEIVVYLQDQVMTVNVDGRTRHVWQISSGRKGKATLPGTYHPQFFSIDHRSSLYDNAPMPFSIFFNGDYAIHGTYERGRLGQRASAGCIRLSVDKAEVLYRLVSARAKEETEIRIWP